ncbi:Oxidoreductase molybdopterin binding domain protein [compost metagenome]
MPLSLPQHPIIFHKKSDTLNSGLIDGLVIRKLQWGVPAMYDYKSVKWLTRIELTEEDHTGYWEERGYAKDAWV